MEKIHRQYGHLSFGSLKNIIESRAWWPSMDYDLRAFVSACPNCQTHQRHRSTQEREEHQVVSDPFIQLHDHSNGYPGRTSTLSDWLQTRVMIQHKLSPMSSVIRDNPFYLPALKYTSLLLCLMEKVALLAKNDDLFARHKIDRSGYFSGCGNFLLNLCHYCSQNSISFGMMSQMQREFV